MKKQLLYISLIALSVILFSNFTSNSETKNFVFMFNGDDPVLPVVSFNYGDVDFPSHIIEDTIPVGYESGHIDTSAFDFIEDDIATLGRVLFYDEKLSALENISCASCHNQAESFAENKVFSEGVSKDTRRNSMQLNDIGWTSNGFFFWDMSQTDLHEMIILPLKDENEIGADIDDVRIKLNATTYYPALFKNAFGDEEITESRIVDALVHFISSMNTFNSKFDQEASQGFPNFTDLELEGKELFTFTCANCHQEGSIGLGFLGIDPNDPGSFVASDLLFEFPFFFTNGLPIDPNNDDLGAGEWNNSLNHLFKIPTLRNIDKTAPYMHDGRFETLEDVVDFYSEGVEFIEWPPFFIPENGFKFTSREKSALVAFMKTLTDESFLTNEKWSDPFENSSNLIEEEELEGLLVMPNPMSNYAVIKFENPNNEISSVEVISSNGQLVHKEETTTNKIELDKLGFFPGNYFIYIKQGDKSSSQQLIVQ